MVNLSRMQTSIILSPIRGAISTKYYSPVTIHCTTSYSRATMGGYISPTSTITPRSLSGLTRPPTSSPSASIAPVIPSSSTKLLPPPSYLPCEHSTPPSREREEIGDEFSKKCLTMYLANNPEYTEGMSQKNSQTKYEETNLATLGARFFWFIFLRG